MRVETQVAQCCSGILSVTSQARCAFQTLSDALVTRHCHDDHTSPIHIQNY